jgi:PKD repeat protein
MGEIGKGRSIESETMECINLYLEKNSNSGKNQYSLIGTPGTRLYLTIPGRNFRGMISTAKDRLFIIIDKTLWEITAKKEKINRGSINSISGMVSFAENEFQMILVDGVDGFIFTFATNILVKINSIDYRRGSNVINKDGYFIQNMSGTNQFYYSAYQNGLIWDASDYYYAEGSADNILTIGKIHNEIWIFGQKSVEVWGATGNVDDPFSRINQGSCDYIGISAKYSVASNPDAIFWLGAGAQGHGIVWMANAYQPQRISTHAVEYSISQMKDITDAIGFCYQDEGHFFYYLNFPKGNRTFCYDITIGLWHERALFNVLSGLNGGHNLIAHAYFNGKNLIGNFNNGNIFELNLNIYTDNDIPIKRIFTFPHLAKENKRITFNNLEIDMDKGIGTFPQLTKTETIDFTAVQINNSLNCQFTDISTGFVSGWFWDFNDGVTQSNTFNPLHHFPIFGTYLVGETLTYNGLKDGFTGSGTVTKSVELIPTDDYEIQDTIDTGEDEYADTTTDLNIIQKIN